MDALAREIAALDEEYKEEIVRLINQLGASINDQIIGASAQETITTVAQDGSTGSETRSTVPTTRMRRIMNEIDAVEREYGDVLYDNTVEAMDIAIAAVIAHLLDSHPSMTVQAKLNADETLGKTVRIGDKTLQQRTQSLAAETLSDVRGYIRQGVFEGLDVDEITKNVRQSFADSDWKVRRIVESEIYQAYRYQFGETSSRNGFDWIRIHESFPRHPRRKMHRCYSLANTDKYGMGAGVYRSTDVEIYYPHPQCTSWLEVVEALD